MDFVYRNVHEYLQALGVLENGTPEAIDIACKEFRRLYLKHYKVQYAETHSNVTISFTKADKKRLKDHAKNENKRLASFIKDNILLILEPKTESQLSDECLSELVRLISLSLDIIEELLFENEYPRFNDSLQQLECLIHTIKALLEK